LFIFVEEEELGRASGQGDFVLPSESESQEEEVRLASYLLSFPKASLLALS